ncbi:MAG: CinA family protein [Anaerolineales bacterium]
MGSVTAYAYEAKVRLLGVKWETLETYGAVSEQVAEEMATGVRNALGADIGLSISGIAGPGGGTEEKPVGMVCFGLSSPERVWTSTQHFDGDRLAVKEQSADFILSSLLAYLNGELV